MRLLSAPDGQLDLVIQAAAEPILAAVIPQLRAQGGKNWRNMATFLDVLRQYAAFGSQYREHLFKLETFEAINEFILVTSQWNSAQYQLEYQPLLMLLSLLVRSTSVGSSPKQSPIEYRTDAADASVMGRSDFLPAQESILNALKDSNGFAMKLASVVQKPPDSAELVALTPLFCYIMSGNEALSHSLTCSLMTSLDQTTYSHIHGQLQMWKSLMLIDDGLRPLRLQLFHLNPREDRSIVGIFEMMNFSKTRAPKKTYFLLKFINWEINAMPDACQFLMSEGILVRWSYAPNWLRMEIDRLGDIETSNVVSDVHNIVRSPSALGLLEALEVG